jgi:hypothetical protein
LRNFCAQQGLVDIAVEELVVEEVGSWAVPSRIAFGKDLKSLLARDESYRRSVLEHAQQIVGTGKTVREEETRALERIRRELNLTV